MATIKTGNFACGVTTKQAGTHTLTNVYGVYMADSSGGDVIMTLPPATTISGVQLSFKKISASNVMTITASGTQLIDGVASQTYAGLNDEIKVVSIGTGWIVDGVGLNNSTYLTASGNLDTLTSASDARTNLGLGSAATYDVGTGEGDIGLLGSGGKYDIDLMPSVLVNTVYSVADIAARDAIVAPNTGDVAVVTDAGGGISKSYIWNGSAWVELTSGAGGVGSVNGKSGTVVIDKVDVGLANVTNDAQLKIASNLSDLANVATARTNLGLGSGATANIGLNQGDLIVWSTGASITTSGTISALNLHDTNWDTAFGWGDHAAAGYAPLISPSFTTPTLGVATATSLNGNSLTTGTGTLTLSTYTLTMTGNASVQGTNTGDQTLASLAAEAVANKVTSISESSTDTQYPSAKLLYDQLALKQGLSNSLTSIAGLSYSALSFVKMSASGTFSLDTNTYLTTLSGSWLDSTNQAELTGNKSGHLI